MYLSPPPAADHHCSPYPPCPPTTHRKKPENETFSGPFDFFFLTYSVDPKSETIVCPVMALDSSEAKKSSMPATSCGMQG